MPRPRPQRDRRRAEKGADPVHAGEDADAARREVQAVLADHRDHAGERPAEHVVDDRDGEDRHQPPVAPRHQEALDHVRHHRARGDRRDVVAVLQAECRGDRQRIGGDADRERAGDAEAGQHQPADRRPQHAAGVVGADIDRHRRAHPLGADDLADHHPPHRVVGRPGDAVAEAGDRQLPHFEHAGIGQRGDHRRGRQHRQADDDLRPTPLDALDIGADQRAEQHHRRHSQ